MSDDLKLQGTIKQKTKLSGELNSKEKLQGIIKTPLPKKALQFEIELSTDMGNPTELLDYIDKSGIYIAKNMGIIGVNGEPFTILAKGQFFEVQNFKDLGKVMGEEISDEDNMINIAIPSIEGYMYYLLYQNGEWLDSINITSQNVNDYVSVDTSRLIDKYNNVNAMYGVYMNGNYLSVYPATQYDINNGTNAYKPITSNIIEYAVQKKGEKHFTKLADFNTLNNDITTLKNEIEEILNTVVTVDE